MNETTLGEVVTRVIKAKLGFNEPTIMQGSNCLYEEGEGADEDLQANLTLMLAQCPAGGVVDGAQLEIEDFTQNLEVRACYYYCFYFFNVRVCTLILCKYQYLLEYLSCELSR